MNLLEAVSHIVEKPNLSDIHIKSDMKIRSRVNGDMIIENLPVPSNKDITTFLHTIDRRLDGKDLHSKLDEIDSMSGGTQCGYNFSCFINDVRYRGNLSLSNGRKLSLVLRMLNSKIPELDSLQLPAIFKTLISKSNGLCLITGATGSGKSTTLASALDYINHKYDKHILAIEDPTEYVLKEDKCLISQKEVGFDVPSFGAAMRDSLRQDPDIVMLGEIRDAVTMRTAMSMAETGHLVFGTLHTNGAVSTVERCVSFFDPAEKELARHTLGSVLNFVMSQSLAKRADGSGRIMAYELMIKTNAIKQNVVDNKPNLITNAMETGGSDGHVLMHNVLNKYVREGTITREEALASANNYEKMKEILK